MEKANTLAKAAKDNFSFYELYLKKTAKTLIICYGVTAKSAKAVYNKRKKSNEPTSLLILKTLWPVPVNLIKKMALMSKRIVVPEMNLGLYVLEIERVVNNKTIVKNPG